MDLFEAINKAELLIERERYEEAKKMLYKSLQSDISNSYAFELLAICEINLKDFLTAQEVIDESLKLSPNSSHAHFLQALIHFQNESLFKAESSVMEAISFDSTDASYYELLTRIYIVRKDNAAARDALNMGLKIDPNSAELHRLKAIVSFDRRDASLAVKSIKDGLREEPNNPDLLYLMGMHSLDEKTYDKAEEYFRNALSVNPMMEDARMGLAETKKAKSKLFRIFFRYGFSRWTYEFNWKVIILILLGIKFIWIWGILFILFLLFTWYGDVLYNSFLRINDYSSVLLTKSKIKQFNFFLGANGVILFLLLLGRVTNEEMVWKMMVLTIVGLFMGLAFFEVELKRQQKSIALASVFLLGLLLLGITTELSGFVVLALLALVLFGILFSFRVIGW